MRNNALGLISLLLVLITVLATAFVFSMGERLREWVNTELAFRGLMATGFLGCVLGGCSFKTATGRAAGIIGVVLLGSFIYLLMADNTVEPILEVSPTTQSTASKVILISDEDNPSH